MSLEDEDLSGVALDEERLLSVVLVDFSQVELRQRESPDLKWYHIVVEVVLLTWH